MVRLNFFLVICVTTLSALSFGIKDSNLGSMVYAQVSEPILDTVKLGKIDTNLTTPRTIIDTFSASGSISSLIYQTDINRTSDLATAKKFILSGEWLIHSTRGVITAFAAKFNQVLDDGKSWHSHEFFNFRTDMSTRVHLTTDNSAIFSGIIDIKLNNTTVWKGIRSAILILKGNTVIFVPDDKAIGEHFRGQPIYGTVLSIKDKNGKEMKKITDIGS